MSRNPAAARRAQRASTLPELRAEAHDLPPEYTALLTNLLVAGANPNTLRGYETDFRYLSAWKWLAFDAPLVFPESETVALRFILDHTSDLAAMEAEAEPRRIAEALIAAGLRRKIAQPTPGSLARRIASWRTFHGWKTLSSPFEAPAVRRALAAARRVANHAPARKSAHPVTMEVLDQLLAASGPGLTGLRDRALLETGWASGGRRRSELAALQREDVDLDAFTETGVVGLRLLETKTHRAGEVPRLVLKGRAARALVAWIDAAGIESGPLFRPITRERVTREGLALPGAVQRRGLSPDGVRMIFKKLLVKAGYPEDWASPHGLRSGFLTEAARRGVPLQAAMRMSLHRSVEQAVRYYDDVEIEDNPATDLRGE